jgi:hypothetical protein
MVFIDKKEKDKEKEKEKEKRSKAQGYNLRYQPDSPTESPSSTLKLKWLHIQK